MTNKKVAVLLSTYNGADYLPDFLESLKSQTYNNIELFVRDDGSSDNSAECIEKMDLPFPCHIEKGENVGFCESFMRLLKNADADYYSFADQDDIWYPEKIEWAVEWLDKQGDNTPLLYHAGYDIIAGDKNKIGKFMFSDDKFDFRRSLTENHYSGFCMVVNNPLKNLMLQGRPSEYVFHDWWAAILVQAFGKAHFDNRICAAHKAHGNNVTRQSLGRKIKWFLNGLINGSDTKRRNLEFFRLYGDRVKGKDKKILSLFCSPRYNLIYSLKKFFYPKRWRPDIPSEIAIRFLMLIGRI